MWAAVYGVGLILRTHGVLLITSIVLCIIPLRLYAEVAMKKSISMEVPGPTQRQVAGAPPMYIGIPINC